MTVYRAGQPEEDMVTVTHELTGDVEQIPVSEILRQVWTMADRHLLHAGVPHTLRCMQAVQWFVRADKPLPADLKKWFLDGLEEHARREGGKTLDEIYGFRREEKKRNAFKESTKELSDLAYLASLLVLITGMKISQASRLVVWREGSEVDPLSVDREYRRDNKKDMSAAYYFWREVEFSRRSEPIDEWPYKLHVSFLESFQKAADKIDAGHLDKELAALGRSLDLVRSMTAADYLEYLFSKKAD